MDDQRHFEPADLVIFSGAASGSRGGLRLVLPIKPYGSFRRVRNKTDGVGQFVCWVVVRACVTGEGEHQVKGGDW